ncbi:uncharacterized protein FTOL_10088 [Fusarium torulosum]|uniref:Uncharacterized protein n=1 Tax=Fusarium torulosum TaxID=33205 RepID=A0AAE8SLQ3_9HYPO|nr:uncharacterized protein FTOL_10088 [Fusarium torulosum]
MFQVAPCTQDAKDEIRQPEDTAVIPLVLTEEVAPSGWLILTEVSEANLRASGTGCALSDKELNILHRDSHVKRILAVVHLIRTGGAVNPEAATAC